MMGYGPEDKNSVLELTYNYDVKEYDKGNAYGQVYSIQWSIIQVMFHCLLMPLVLQFRKLIFLSFQIAIGTYDVYKTAEVVRQNGGQITREPGPLPGISTKITACTDPDGWKSVCVFLDLVSPFSYYFSLHVCGGNCIYHERLSVPGLCLLCHRYTYLQLANSLTTTLNNDFFSLMSKVGLYLSNNVYTRNVFWGCYCFLSQ